jgi:hypothetical protein
MKGKTHSWGIFIEVTYSCILFYGKIIYTYSHIMPVPILAGYKGFNYILSLEFTPCNWNMTPI